MSSESLTAIGIVRAKPGQTQELGRRMAGLLAPTRAEPGCLAYDLYQSTEDPAVWVFIERWHDVNALKVHVQAAHFQAFLSHADDVLDGAPDNILLKPVSP